MNRISQVSKKLADKKAKKNASLPLDIFPRQIQNYINSSNYILDFFGTGILSTSATAIGSGATLDNSQWISKPILWLAIVGRSGEGKTHPLNEAIAPLHAYDQNRYQLHKAELQEYENLYKEERDKKRRPKHSKFVMQEYTPEYLAINLDLHRKGALIFKDELMGLVGGLNKYRDGADQQMYIELYNGNPLTVDRVTKDSLRVTNPNVNILGGLQPKLLKDFSGGNRDKDGFLARFLFVHPVDPKPIFFRKEIPDPKHKANYEKIIKKLIELKNLSMVAPEIAQDMFIEWQKKHRKITFNDDLQTEIQAKLETYVWRLALIIELLHQAARTSKFSGVLSATSMEKALKLVEYFRENALKVHDTTNQVNPLVNLKGNKMAVYITIKNGESIKRKDLLPLFAQHGIRDKAFDRFIQSEYFTKTGHGRYRKKFDT